MPPFACVLLLCLFIRTLRDYTLNRVQHEVNVEWEGPMYRGCELSAAWRTQTMASCPLRPQTQSHTTCSLRCPLAHQLPCLPVTHRSQECRPQVQLVSRMKLTSTSSADRSLGERTAPNLYYGHEDTAKVYAHFVTHLFTCPQSSPHNAENQSAPRLDLFIAYTLHRTRPHESVSFAAVYLLQRLKARFPAARGSSGPRLFISAFMLSSKIICDDTYSNKSSSIVGQGISALREINQMEREMCSYLEW